MRVFDLMMCNFTMASQLSSLVACVTIGSKRKQQGNGCDGGITDDEGSGAEERHPSSV